MYFRATFIYFSDHIFIISHKIQQFTTSYNVSNDNTAMEPFVFKLINISTNPQKEMALSCAMICLFFLGWAK